ncbi:MAG TPA: type II secretion system F family protein [Acidimicrobiales bacterium]|nr:type II secretion system F family protein [Acidimicrobiales bacterium]
MVLLASSIGVHLGLALPFAACMGVAATATFVPVASLRSEARSERRRFRRAFGCWLDLVALAQAAGMGVESALSTASDMGLGPAFSMIHRAVDVARSAGSTPWEGLARLGREIGMPELEELAASLALAGTEGARVRSSLVAKAESLRTRDLAESEAEANAVTERLFLPAVVMMLGFLLFICYPAVVTVAHGL